MKITITRALSELKMLKKKLDKEVRDLKAIAVQHGSKLRGSNSYIRPEDFSNQAIAQIQSIEAIQARILDIKTKIDISNSTTVVTIGGVAYTVLEALAKKSLIEYSETYLTSLKLQYKNATNDYESALGENRYKVEKQLEDWSRNNNNSKPTPDAEKNIVSTIEQIYEVKLVDPCMLSDKIKSLEKQIEDFKLNIDYALSESNSITSIEIDD
jgi:hypothetical protein